MKKMRWTVLSDLLAKDRTVKLFELGLVTSDNMKNLLRIMPNLFYFGVHTFSDDFCRDFSDFYKLSMKYGPRATLIKSSIANGSLKIHDHSADCVFLNYEYSYKNIFDSSAYARDLSAWKDKVAPGGVIAGRVCQKKCKAKAQGVTEQIIGKIEWYPDQVWIKRI